MSPLRSVANKLGVGGVATLAVGAVLVDAEGQGRIIERRFDAAAETTGETALDFGWRP